MIQKYNQKSQQEVQSDFRKIEFFEINNEESTNIDLDVVRDFGDEWEKFHNFQESEIKNLGDKYFDIINDHIINKNTYGIDIGCGTGRWAKYLSKKIGFMEAIDPSNAIFVADKLLGDISNVRLARASVDNIPFDDNTFDFAMSIGVLHHIPNTQKAMTSCVKKVKLGGYFYTYLYYNLDNKGMFFKGLLGSVTMLRKIICKLPHSIKKIVCDIIAVILYMPFVLLGRCLKVLGLENIADKLPLSGYQDQSFFIIRNDALDRFGTKLEQRFSKVEIIQMMEAAGLGDIVVSDKIPYWHAIGKRIK